MKFRDICEPYGHSAPCKGFWGVIRGHVYVLYDISIIKIALQIIKVQHGKHGQFGNWNGLNWKKYGDREEIIIEYDRTYGV